ncbi:P-loop containing nucleoside triphosphate hydrolase protein [Poronia punctata]|nr:P-loop containing nucleoside triphosphate hydrolase protein [Poronia punctata]
MDLEKNILYPHPLRTHSLLKSLVHDIWTEVYKWLIGIYKRVFIVTAPPPPSSPLIIFLLGAPGAGKGTQATLLQQSFREITLVSYGDLIRHHDNIPGSWVNRLPRRKSKSKSKSKSGNGNPIVPADVAARLVRETIQGQAKKKMIWLVDGFPRCREHVEAWWGISTATTMKYVVVYLSCPRDVLVQRVLARAERPGDKDREVVEERVDRNIDEREGLVESLEELGVVVREVDAGRNVDVVRREVCDIYREAVGDWKDGRR